MANLQDRLKALGKLEEKYNLLKKYDFGKWSKHLSPDRSKNYVHGFGNAIVIVSMFAQMISNQEKTDESRMIKNLEGIYQAYGFVASCYNSVDYEEIKKDGLLKKLIPETKRKIDILGSKIYKLAQALAESSYVVSDAAKSICVEINNMYGEIREDWNNKYDSRTYDFRRAIENHMF
jgi:hypothetical protein